MTPEEVQEINEALLRWNAIKDHSFTTEEMSQGNSELHEHFDARDDLADILVKNADVLIELLNEYL